VRNLIFLSFILTLALVSGTLNNPRVPLSAAAPARYLAATAGTPDCAQLFKNQDYPKPEDFDPKYFFDGEWYASLAPLALPPLQIKAFLDSISVAYKEFSKNGKTDPHQFFSRLLEEFRTPIQIQGEMPVIPDGVPVIFVANHPTGTLDGMFLMKLATQLRPNTKLVATRKSLAAVKLRDFLIAVDKSDPKGETAKELAADQARIQTNNLAAMKEMLQLLSGEGNGAIAVFPSGEINHWDANLNRPVEGPWVGNIFKMARKKGAVIIPVNIALEGPRAYYSGENGAAVQPSMFLSYTGLRLSEEPTVMFVGKPVDSRSLPEDEVQAAAYMREQMLNLWPRNN